MKNFQQNLLIGFALALCGLCVYQWHQQTAQRNAIETLDRMVYEKSIAVRDSTNAIATLTLQVNRMDAQITEFRNTAETNAQLIASQKREIGQLQFTCLSLSNAITQYQQGVATLKAKLEEAYDGINRQNESISNLVVQRDDLVKKYNDSVKDRNDVVAKYNDLAKQLQKAQSNN